jgi:hypothetical protein
MCKDLTKMLKYTILGHFDKKLCLFLYFYYGLGSNIFFKNFQNIGGLVFDHKLSIHNTSKKIQTKITNIFSCFLDMKKNPKLMKIH